MMGGMGCIITFIFTAIDFMTIVTSWTEYLHNAMLVGVHILQY